MNISPIDIIFLLIAIQFFIPFLQQRLLRARRLQAIRQLEEQRRSRVITLIHRSETLSLLGLPVSRYIDVEDAEQVLRAIHLTPDDMPIDIVIHTPGGLALAAEQIALALSRHKGKVTVLVPHYAMSGGTIIALAADEIILSHDAVLGSVDPVLGSGFGAYQPAVSIMRATQTPNPHRDDQTLVMGDIAEKAIREIHDLLYGLLCRRYDSNKAANIARTLSEGRWTHDHPLFYETVQEMGLPISDAMPPVVFELMKLYPQYGQRRPSVEYVSSPYHKSPPQNEHKEK